MTLYLSTDQESRTSATVYRMGFEMIGTLLPLAVQGPFSQGLDCRNSTNDTIDIEILTDVFSRQKYAIFALIFSVIFAIGTLLLIFFVNEKSIYRNIKILFVIIDNKLKFFLKKR